MHEALSKSHFEQDVEFLSERLVEAKRWIVHSKDYPHVEVTFLGSRPLRVRLLCDNWPELPPSAILMSADGSDPKNLPGSVFHQDAHPITGKPFICMRGFREYHTHSSHLGDRWENYRGQDGMNLPGLLVQLSSAWRKAVGP
ncbi:hypothetical protein ISP13_13155 [Dyella lipolytica]|uniref:Metal binding domain-containing protein n=2 Tax=Dyella lipolytica TaxID=1867835 RepID=A0ABW8IYP7_9GAMM